MKTGGKALTVVALAVSLQLCGAGESTSSTVAIPRTVANSGVFARAKATVAPYWHSGMQTVQAGTDYVWQRTPARVRTILSNKRFKIAAVSVTTALAALVVVSFAYKMFFAHRHEEEAGLI